MEANNYSRSEKETVRERVLDYAKQRKDEPVELNVVSTLVDPQRHKSFSPRRMNRVGSRVPH